MGGYDLDFEDDGASWRVRRERQLRDMIETARRKRTRASRFMRVMLVPPMICGVIFLGTVVFSIVATISGATAAVDFTKPLHIAAGSPICPTPDDAQAIYKQAPNRCTDAPDDLPVVVMQDAGAAGPYRVRVATGDRVAEFWVPYLSLAN
jgi:hypothetical protein